METMKSWRQLGRIGLVVLACLAWPVQHAVYAADFLDPEDAFKFSAAVTEGGKTIEARFSIADGYYLYQERFGFATSDPVQLGGPQYPPGKIKFDKTFNRELVTYRGDVVVRLPVKTGNGPFILTVKLQGCADRGLCYAPDTRTARLALNAASDAWATRRDKPKSVGSDTVTVTGPGRIESVLKSGSLLTVLPIFFLLGTPYLGLRLRELIF